ncbi:acetylcholinesterase-1-like [Dermacentor variabilis]|uniref:acetylcholinesterase-1-like n=1 Tax=Dermacentor variabilis TaxID=34621 RepID=UPI003F5B38CF
MSKSAKSGTKVFSRRRKPSKVPLKLPQATDKNEATPLQNIDPVLPEQAADAGATSMGSPTKGDCVSPGSVNATTMMVRKGSVRGLVSTLSLYNLNEGAWVKRCIPALAIVAVVLVAVSAVTVWIVLRRRVVSPNGSTTASTSMCTAPPGDPTVRFESLGTTVHGDLDQSRQLRKFFGIPYGRNVSLARRFERAQGVTGIGDNGSLYAHRHGPDCPQGDFPKLSVNEECLTLSIWVPVVCTTSSPLKTVLVIVASEWFQFDNTGQLDRKCETLSLGGDIAVVVIKHRLSLLGFLDANSNETPGYVGVDDVFLAIKWISEHIQAFHGDPGRLVGFGFGSGAYIVSMDLFAEAQSRKRYFKRLLLHGISPASLIPRVRLDDLSKLMTALQCPSATNSKACVECLKKASLKRIYEEAAKLQPLFFTPDCDQPPFDGCDKIFTKLPSSLRGIEILCGYNVNDGREFLNQYVLEQSRNRNTIQVFEKLQTLFTRKKRQHTFKDLPVEKQRALDKDGDADVHGFIELVSDMSLRCPMIELARQTAAKGASVYLYGSDNSNKLLEPAVMMADIVAFAKRGQVVFISKEKLAVRKGLSNWLHSCSY